MGVILFKVILEVLRFCLSLLLILVGIVFLTFLVFGSAVALQFWKSYKKGFRFVRMCRRRVPGHGFMRRLLVDVPAMIVYDLTHRDPEQFGYHGVVLFTGRQGYGKTIAMSEFILRIREEHPLSRCLSNYALHGQDGELNHWTQLVSYRNGRRGVIIGIDELQNWFSSRQSSNFPPAMLEVITQNRKNARIIVGTSQNFSAVSKPIRVQCTEVRECVTFLGCVTLVHRKRAELNADGDVERWHHVGWYWFVHTPALRDSYDTYRVVESLAKSGFKDLSEQLPE